MEATQNDELVLAMRNAGRALAQQPSIRDLEDTLARIVIAAVDTIPAVDAASISLTVHERIETRHPTTDLIRKLDDTQSELREGPCIGAIDDPPPNGIIVAQDLADEDMHRWPRFAPYAVEAGYLGLMSTQLSTETSMRGALNLYSATADAFDEQSRTLCGLFGVQAALVLYGANHAAHLQKAVDSRDLIGQAKGILMERFTVDAHAAFQMLVKSSQDTNVKLTRVATWLTTAPARAARPKDTIEF
ncbi:GAF and ANTAR domain-containing protein [Actinomycetospora sp. C-140]